MTFQDLKEKMFIDLKPVPDLMIERYLLESLYRFLRDSHAYIFNDTVSTVVEQTEYDLSSILNSFEIDEITQIYYNSAETPLADSMWSLTRPATLVLGWTPDSAITDGLDIYIAATTRDETVAASLPEHIFNRFGDAIVGGAAERLFRVRNRPWFDMEQAREHLFEYHRGVTESLNERRRNIRMRPN